MKRLALEPYRIMLQAGIYFLFSVFSFCPDTKHMYFENKHRHTPLQLNTVLFTGVCTSQAKVTYLLRIFKIIQPLIFFYIIKIIAIKTGGRNILKP